MTRPTQRARTEMLSFDQLDLAKLQFKDIKSNPKGPPSVIVLYEGVGPRFNLTPTGWLNCKYGFDISGKYSRPSFLGGPAPENEGFSEGLALRIFLDSEQAKFLREIDQKACEEYKAFGKADWQPLVHEDPVFDGPPSVKVHVTLAGQDLTKLTIVDGEEPSVDRGEGWEFLKAYMPAFKNFRNSEVKVCLSFGKVWNVAKKAGLKLKASRLVLKASPAAAEEDPFGNDAELFA